MNIATTIDDVQYAASICLKCGCCTYSDWPENHPLCPIFYRDECFAHGGGGFMSIVAALGEDLLQVDPKIAALAYACSSCMACDSRCTIIKAHPPQVDMLDMVRLVRYEAVKKGLIPDGYAKQIYEEIKTDGAPKNDTPLELPQNIKSENADTLVFSECSHSTSQKTINIAVANMLEKIGEPVGVFSEKGCCGSTLYDLGFWDHLGELIKGNWEKMKTFGDKTFVFTNPHCQEFITKRYPENLADYSEIKQQHISEVIAAALQSGKLQSKKNDMVKVSYHDPCYLGRGLEIYEAPRNALTDLDGVELVEMPRNRKSSYCCGAKATGDYYPNQAEYAARERIKEFESTGADLLITACPYCKDNFQKVLSDGEKESVMDLCEFINTRV